MKLEHPKWGLMDSIPTKWLPRPLVILKGVAIQICQEKEGDMPAVLPFYLTWKIGNQESSWNFSAADLSIAKFD